MAAAAGAQGNRCVHIAGAFVRHDLDVEHHALILVIEDVTVQDKLADIAGVSRSLHDVIILLDEDGVAKDTLEIAILRIGHRPALRILQIHFGAMSVGGKYRSPAWIPDVQYLERIDVDVKDMRGESGGDIPILRRAQ